MSRTDDKFGSRRGFVCMVMCVLAGLAGPASSEQAVILGVWAAAHNSDGIFDDVRLGLAWEEGLVPASRVEIEDSRGNVVASQLIPGAAAVDESNFRIFVQDVLADVRSREEWSYRVHVRKIPGDESLATSFPFHVVGCAGSYGLIPGLATSAMVVSRELDLALEGHVGNLEALTNAYPGLSCEIDELGAQLDTLESQLGDQCYWQVVIEDDLQTVQSSEVLGGTTFKGVKAGSSHCFSARREGRFEELPDGPPPVIACHPEGFTATRTRLETKIRCRDFRGDFPSDGCDGRLEISAELKAIAEANVQFENELSAACAYERMDLVVDKGKGGVSMLARASDGVGQFHPNGDIQKAEIASFTASADQPSKVVLVTTGGAQATTQFGIQAFAEYGNTYALKTTATSNCTVRSERQIELRSPDFLTARKGFITYLGTYTAPLWVTSKSGQSVPTKSSTGGIKDSDW